MTDRAERLRARLLATFREEADEHLRTIAGELEAVAAESSAEAVGARLETLFRTMHTLKGAARSVGISEFEAACHACEAQLSDLVHTQGRPDARFLRVLQETSDLLARYLAGTASPLELAEAALALAAAPSLEPTPVEASTPEPVVAQPAVGASEVRDAVRVDTGQLDRLVALAENLLTPKLAAAAHAARAAEIVEQLRELRQRGSPLEDVRALEGRVRAHATALRSDERTLRTTVDDLYDELLRIRITAASTMLEGFPLMVRDLCRITGKDVAWESSGGHLEIDRKVIALVKDPLIHMVRNAIDHGIESPDERAAAGKPRRGRVAIAVAPLEGGRISIEVTDDGRGFALDALRDAAVRSRLASPEQAAAMGDADLAELAFNAGVSTSPVVTTISGHGRGLAIVREAIERIEGRITTHSTPGVGTLIRLELPASIVTYRALLVTAAGTPYLFPIDAVERAFPLARDRVVAALAAGRLAHGGTELPFGSLRDVIGLAAPPGDDEDDRRELPCLLVSSSERRGVVLVDEVVGEHEVLIKELRRPLRRVRNILAAGLLGTGEVVLVLRSLDVLRSLRARAHVPGAAVLAAPRALRVLVVDDSVTTRTMVRSLLETGGYRVHVAADGIDAWNVLQTEEIDVVVSDVDMPRLDGFGLTSRIRAHPNLAKLPVVLVTAREQQEDRDRGLRAGANVYVLKSSFDRTNLIEIVRRLA